MNPAYGQAYPSGYPAGQQSGAYSQAYPSGYPPAQYGIPARYGKPGIKKRAYDAAWISAGILAFLWFVVIVFPRGWIYSVNAGVTVSSGLFTVTTSGGWISGFGKAIGALPKGFLDARVSIHELNGIACSMGENQVCSHVRCLWFGSIAMVFFGFLTIVSLAGGAFCLKYYTTHHATETGRNLAMVLFATAPLCSLLGFFSFIGLTFGFMNFSGMMLISGSSFPYSMSAAIASILLVMTPAPFLIQTVYVNAAVFEKRRDDDSDDDYDVTGGYGAGYGAAGGAAPPAAGWYGGAQQQAYGQGGGYPTGGGGYGGMAPAGGGGYGGMAPAGGGGYGGMAPAGGGGYGGGSAW